MTDSNGPGIDIRARLAPMVLVIVGAVLVVGLGRAWLGDLGPTTAPWWAYLILVLLAIAMLALAGAVTIDPRVLRWRIALGGLALAWFGILVGIYATWASTVGVEGFVVALLLLLFGDVAGVFWLAMTTGDAESRDEAPEVFERVATVVTVGAAVLVAIGAIMLVGGAFGAFLPPLIRVGDFGGPPMIAFVAVIVLPPVVFAVASFGSHRAARGTFHAQAAANRRNSVLLLISLIGIIAATAEIIAVSLTFDPIPALWAAGGAVIIGIATAVGADRFGSRIVLESTGAERAFPPRHTVLLDVVRELAIAANIPTPATYVIDDGSLNAFATGRDPEHASIVVTRGLLEEMDREQLQGVIGHELGHIRNLDIRYAMYIAVMVGLVALVTDGFLRLVIESWKQGAFIWRGRGKGALGVFVTGLLVGLFLLIVASLLRLLAPLFSALVQASSSREREFLADATSVEFTRNAAGLERALAALVYDDDTLEAANRGTQHLWFRNPVKKGSDRRVGLLSTHPSLGARIDRLRVLQGLAPRHENGTSDPASET